MLDYQKGTLDIDSQSKRATKIEELRRVCQPVIDYLRKNHTPYEKIIIDWASAELVSGEFGASYEIPYDDDIAEAITNALNTNINQLSELGLAHDSGENSKE